MRVHYEDFIKNISERVTIEQLSEKFFQLGHEHEIKNDFFEFELTPNRGDCLSLRGLLRDLSVFYDTNLTLAIYEGDFENLELDFVNKSPKDCPNISFLEIEIERVPGNYKPYLSRYLEKYDLKKINFFTDVSNYVSFELGQPTHCYDRNTLGNEITFETVDCESDFKTLHGNEIKIHGENSIFKVNNKIVNIAGVIGDESTSCSHQTKKVLIECAFFNPEKIIGKSIKYNINSDAAYKFERGVDPCIHSETLRRFIKIIEDHASIKSLRLKSINEEFIPKTFPINIEKINSILGTKISKDKYQEYLQRIGFRFESKLVVPSFRSDILSENDLAEEIARIIGYNNIPSEEISINVNKRDKLHKRPQIISNLIKNGFNEVINLPFTNEKNVQSIEIDNPLDKNKNRLRTSLKESLISNLLYNERRQKDSIKLFEISSIYTIHETKVERKQKIGVIASGRIGHNYKDFSKKIDEKYLKDIFRSSRANIFIEEISRDKLDSKIKDKIYFIETSFKDFFVESEAFDPSKINFIRYKKISDFPSSIKDFSFLVEDLSKVEDVLSILNNSTHKYLKDSFMFDFYKNKEEMSVKIGFRLIFQSAERTLSDEEIKKSSLEIIDPVLKFEGVSVPGL